jgi:iron complex transport system ATP-binding protein|tara:strand:+ start:2773 stop:3576 length:804 start_codon:yes stop_codon:yes gene_type:complete
VQFEHRQSISFTGEDLYVSYGGPKIIEGLNVVIPSGEVTAIIGPNGCGKSTLLKALSRILTPEEGSVRLDGTDIKSIPTREVARKLGILTQNHREPEAISVSDLVRRGRYPHQGIFDQWSTEDQNAVERALEVTGLGEHKEETVDELSGGQKQRAWIAMILAQDSTLMLLDEPTTHLDMPHQMEILEMLVKLSVDEGRTIVLVLHDINMASRYCTNLIGMKEGKILTTGKPSKVVTTEMVESIFGLKALVIEDPVTGSPLCIPEATT